jgi:1-acyl-sn-glycerol-3-phosphate acyltransferase
LRALSTPPTLWCTLPAPGRDRDVDDEPMSKHQLFWRTTQLTFCKMIQGRYRFALDPAADPEPEPPYVVVANHGNFFDPWILGPYFAKALHIMMNDDGFRAGAVSRWYLQGIGAFAKKKGAHDLKAMKSTLKFLRDREPVLIFPEGQATWDGETQPIYGGIERMVKRAKCPLSIVRFRGNFLSRPWWAETDRKGRIAIERTVVPAERLAEMNEPEVLETIVQGIYNNDILDERNRAVEFKGKRMAEGLQRLVWTCMCCETADGISVAGDTITCDHCNNTWTIDAHCRLRADSAGIPCYDDVYAWFQEHKRAAREAIAAASDETSLATDKGVTLLREDDRGRFVPESVGTLSLTRSEISFVPESGGLATLRFEVEQLTNYVIQKKDVFEITHDGVDYRFEMYGRSPMKWLVFVRYLRGFEEAEQRRVI